MVGKPLYTKMLLTGCDGKTNGRQKSGPGGGIGQLCSASRINQMAADVKSQKTDMIDNLPPLSLFFIFGTS